MKIVITGIDLTEARQVLLLAPDTLSSEELYEITQELTNRFNGCNFVLLAGDFKVVAVNKKDALYEIES